MSEAGVVMLGAEELLSNYGLVEVGDIHAMELMDSTGNLIARSVRFGDLTSEAEYNFRVNYGNPNWNLTYTVVRGSNPEAIMRRIGEVRPNFIEELRTGSAIECMIYFSKRENGVKKK